MENEWLQKRMRVDLPFMAHMPHSYGEVGFKAGNKHKNFAAPPATALSRNHRQATSTRTWLRTAVHSCMPPSETRIEVPWPPAECSSATTPEFAGRPRRSTVRRSGVRRSGEEP